MPRTSLSPRPVGQELGDTEILKGLRMCCLECHLGPQILLTTTTKGPLGRDTQGRGSDPSCQPGARGVE